MHNLALDFRFGLRLLARQPLLAVTSVLALALGLGTAITVFSFAEVALLRPLSLPRAAELVMIWEAPRDQPGGGALTSPPTFEEWRGALDGLARLGLSLPWRPVVEQGADLVSLRGARVTPGFFALLGIEPLYGRLLTPGDDGATNEVVLDYRAWQRRFGGDPGIVGRTLGLIDVDGPRPATVVGILPPAVRLVEPMVLGRVEVFAPAGHELRRTPRSQRFARVVGRLAPGVEPAEIRERLRAVSARLAETYPDSHRGWRADVARVVELMRAPMRPALTLLLVAAALVLAIACANVAILLLAAAGVRRREIALRLALGASRWRVARQLLIEALLLATAGVLAGWLLAYGTLNALDAMMERVALPREQTVLEPRVLAFGLLLALVTTVLFGLIPALRAPRVAIAAQLVENAAGSGGGGRGAERARRFLVVIQIALSMMLLVLAGLTLRSFRELLRVDPGFESERVLAMRLQLPRRGPPAERPELLYEELLTRVSRLPGVEHAALVNQLPMRDGGMTTRAFTHLEEELGTAIQVELYGVSPEYFRVMGIPLLTGEPLPSPGSRPPGEPPLLLLSHAAAASLERDDDGLARPVYLDFGARGRPWRVAGLVGDVRQHGLESAPQPTAYLLYDAVPNRAMTLVVRTAGEPSALIQPIRAAIRELGRPLVVEETRPLAAVVAETIATPRLRALLVTLFALVSLLLATVGTYSVTTHAVTQRRHELGVRLALGARPRQLLRLIWRDGLLLIVPGILAGLAASWLALRLGGHFAVGIEPHAAVLLLSPALLLLVAFLAIHAAARRVLRTDPTTLLRTL